VLFIKEILVQNWQNLGWKVLRIASPLLPALQLKFPMPCSRTGQYRSASFG
jgi:hypothetical protein